MKGGAGAVGVRMSAPWAQTRHQGLGHPHSSSGCVPSSRGPLHVERPLARCRPSLLTGWA